MSEPPPSHIQKAFGIEGTPEALAGGQGDTWRCNNFVYKKINNTEEVNWIAELSKTIDSSELRFAKYHQSITGEWVVEGWCVQTLLAGNHQKRHWQEKNAVCSVFHRMIADIPKPAFIDDRNDRWARADRMVWGELPIEPSVQASNIVNRIAEQLLPLQLKSQLIHGDISGNILFDEAARPAVIDITPYWRPAAFARAVLAVDLYTWDTPDDAVFVLFEDEPLHAQLLARAALRRILEEDNRYRDSGRRNEEEEKQLCATGERILSKYFTK